MVPNFSRGAGRAAVVLCLVAAALAGAVFMQVRPAEAQGIMAAPPACQCSAPTRVPGLSMDVVHCVCGGMACVISSGKLETTQSTPLMQCVR